MPSLPRKRLLFGGVALVVILGFLAVNKSKVALGELQDQESLTAAIRRGGLREAAKIKRHYEGIQPTSGWIKYDLEALTENSSMILVGTPLNSSSNLTGSGEQIVTEYKVRVDEPLKGNSGKNQLVNVVIPGGKVTFEDGTSAEIKTPDLGPIEEKKTYVFFLSQSQEGDGVFRLTGGGQGVFELSSSIVKPLGHSVDVVQKHRNQPLNDFIEEIRTAIRKHAEKPQ